MSLGYLAITENMTGGKAMKLGDVSTMRNGKTVEIMNTDAEGRLILADALSYAVEHQPHRLLDLATLTGACIVALGPKVAGLFSNDASLCQDLIAASRRTGERVWRLPLDDDYKEQLKSHVADLKNVGGKWGGASHGGQVSRAVRGLDAVDPPRYRRAELVRFRERDSRRGRDRLLRPNVGRLRGANGGIIGGRIGDLTPARNQRHPGQADTLKSQWIEAAFDAPAVDVESLEDLEHVVHGHLDCLAPTG